MSEQLKLIFDESARPIIKIDKETVKIVSLARQGEPGSVNDHFYKNVMEFLQDEVFWQKLKEPISIGFNPNDDAMTLEKIYQLTIDANAQRFDLFRQELFLRIANIKNDY